MNGAPVVLLYGATPAYRDSLAEGATAADVTGPDVEELNADLVALGYVTSADRAAIRRRSATGPRWAWRALQAHLG